MQTVTISIMVNEKPSKQDTTRFEAVIFDRDGVLIDFDLPRATADFKSFLPFDGFELGRRWGQWGQQVGFPRTVDEEQRFFRGFWDQLSDELGLSDTVRAQLHDVNYTDYLVPYPDAYPALSYAKSHGLKIGVLSNFGLASLQHSLDAVGLGSLVDVAVTASVTQVSKPDPRAYLGIAAELGAPPVRCLLFDDKPECVNGALAVGMAAYLVDRYGKYTGWKHRAVANLSALNALIAKDAMGSA